MDSDNEENWSIFPLHENLSNSYVDPSKLISHFETNQHPIGMKNFKSRSNNRTQIANPQTQQFQKHFLFQNGSSGSLARQRWRTAALKVRMLDDPWAEFKLDKYPTEVAIRHRYNAIKKEWIRDECTVKMETNQFANGAMRACFRLKKLSNFVHKDSWEHASNYVAKCYMSNDVPRQRYFDDVKLQMDAKLWAEIYNRHNPPKKIDMFQVSILEFKNRSGSPLYHLEHFIDGKYIKYNSNSGFVEDAHIRFTPQAFSHFTFESSNHDLIVVDIQGVGDLYTDPQIHTALGTDYGDGNLGVKGFALFFSSHICNDVCKSLGLTQFDLAPSETKCQEKLITSMQKCLFTQSRGLEEVVVGSPSSFGEYFRHRSRCRSETSVGSDGNNSVSDLPDIYESEGYESSTPSPLLSPNNTNNANPMAAGAISINHHHHHSNRYQSNTTNPIQISPKHHSSHMRVGRVRNESSCLDSAFSLEEAMRYFNNKDRFKPRPSCVGALMINRTRKSQGFHDGDDSDDDEDEDETMNYHHKIKNRVDSIDEEEEESILGKIHLELCKYHEIGRFIKDENSDEFDSEAAFFHLKQAADLGAKDALANIGKIYLQLPHDILPNYTVEDNDANRDIGFNYILQNADKGDKNSMYFIAKALDTGIGLSKNRPRDWLQAYEYYQKVVNSAEEEKAPEDAGYCEVNTDCEPTYAILARMAEMNMQGEHGLEFDPSEAADLYTEAAEKAMACGKGRIANKYYMLSEEASSMCD